MLAFRALDFILRSIDRIKWDYHDVPINSADKDL